jgi:hypothetical protein
MVPARMVPASMAPAATVLVPAPAGPSGVLMPVVPTCAGLMPAVLMDAAVTGVAPSAALKLRVARPSVLVAPWVGHSWATATGVAMVAVPTAAIREMDAGIWPVRVLARSPLRCPLVKPNASRPVRPMI